MNRTTFVIISLFEKKISRISVKFKPHFQIHISFIILLIFFLEFRWNYSSLVNINIYFAINIKKISCTLSIEHLVLTETFIVYRPTEQPKTQKYSEWNIMPNFHLEHTKEINEIREKNEE